MPLPIFIASRGLQGAVSFGFMQQAVSVVGSLHLHLQVRRAMTRHVRLAITLKGTIDSSTGNKRFLQTCFPHAHPSPGLSSAP